MLAASSFLGLFNKLLFAFGAGDGDFPLSPGNSYLLTAPGAVIIPVLPIFYTLQHLQIFPVFLIPLIGIAGHHPANRPDHQSVI